MSDEYDKAWEKIEQKISTNIRGGVFIPIFDHDVMDARVLRGDLQLKVAEYSVCLKRPDGRELELMLDADTPVKYFITKPDQTTESENPNGVKVTLREVVERWEGRADGT